MTPSVGGIGQGPLVVSVRSDPVEHMRVRLFFDGDEVRSRLSAFWLLLTLAALIASAGIIGDSTATVIGAMVVAPLMTPILGTALAVALADRTNLLRSLVLVACGAVAVVAISWLAGQLVVFDVVADTNTQVASRVHPRVVDLVAALATGAVGAIAVKREDIADALPGVAIAVSLVPPLAVVGLTLESGAPREAVGAGFLFLTNVAAILTAAIVVFALFGLFGRSAVMAGGKAVNRARASLVIVAFLVIIAVPLVIGSVVIARDRSREAEVHDLASAWAEPSEWQVVDVTTSNTDIVVRAAGPGSGPDPEDLRRAMDDNGLRDTGLRVELVPETVATFPGR